MYVKKIHQFLSSIKKRCTQKKIGSFFLPHGVGANAASVYESVIQQEYSRHPDNGVNSPRDCLQMQCSPVRQ